MAATSKLEGDGVFDIADFGHDEVVIGREVKHGAQDLDCFLLTASFEKPSVNVVLVIGLSIKTVDVMSLTWEIREDRTKER